MKKYFTQQSLKRFILELVLIVGFPVGVLAQLMPGYIAGQQTIGDAHTILWGDLTLGGLQSDGSRGELFFGDHFPSGQKTNTLHLTDGNYLGEEGSHIYQSVTANQNASPCRGYFAIDGTATKTGTGTDIVLDLFAGWDGTCIDLVEAAQAGSDPQTFVMTPTQSASGHTAVLRHRVQNSRLIWFITEPLILNQSTGAQTRCQNAPDGFDPLTVQTVPGTHTYQWYRCNADRTGAVSLGSADGAQTAHYTPSTGMTGTSYYFCVVTSGACAYNTDTTDVSGTITVNGIGRIVSQPSDRFICRGTGGSPVELTVESEGDALTYEWFRNGAAIPNSNNPTLQTALSAGMTDEYYVEITSCGVTERSRTVQVGAALDLIVQRVNTTLMINNNASTNGGYRFAHYTWYKDNELITSGEHDSNLGGHYYTGGISLDPNAQYRAEMITIEGQRLHTCPYTPTIYATSVTIRAYPNPVKKALHGNTVLIEITGMPEAELQNATIDVYYSSGVYMGRLNVNGLAVVPVELPVTGTYVLLFKSENAEKTFKIIVE